jgi:hypothetical protein
MRLATAELAFFGIVTTSPGYAAAQVPAAADSVRASDEWIVIPRTAPSLRGRFTVQGTQAVLFLDVAIREDPGWQAVDSIQLPIHPNETLVANCGNQPRKLSGLYVGVVPDSAVISAGTSAHPRLAWMIAVERRRYRAVTPSRVYCRAP